MQYLRMFFTHVTGHVVWDVTSFHHHIISRHRTYRPFTRRCLYTQFFYSKTVFHTGVLTHRSFDTYTVARRSFYTYFRKGYSSTHTLFHTGAFKHKAILHTHTQTLLHTDASTHRNSYIHTYSHTEASDTSLAQDNRNFTSVLDD